MSAQELRDLFDVASSFCERAFARRGVVETMWHAVTSGGDHLLVGLPNAENRDEAIAMVRALFELRDVVRYIFVDEAWTLEALGSPEQVAEIDKFLQTHTVSEHPDRFEIVILMGEDRDAGLMQARRRIFRPNDRKPYLGKLEMMVEEEHGVDVLKGRLVGLLPQRGMKH